jgi:hypothetical protein
MTDRKFHKRLLTIEVLSEEPIPDGMEVQAIIEEAESGSYSMRIAKDVETELNGKQAARALLNQGSSPEFFSLTEKGEDVHEDANE